MVTNGRTFAHPQTKQKGRHMPQAPLLQLAAPDRTEVVVRAIDERLDHKDNLQPMLQQPNPPPLMLSISITHHLQPEAQIWKSG